MTASSFIPSPRFKFWFWLAGIALFCTFLTLIKSILLPFVVGILAAYFLDPAVRKLHQRHLSRAAAAGVITIGFFVAAIGICALVVPLVAHQFSALIGALPDYLDTLQTHYDTDIAPLIAMLGKSQVATFKEAAGNFGGAAASWAGNVVGGVVRSGLAFLNLLSLVFITPVVVFYLLRDWDALVRQFDQLLPRDNADVIREQLHLVDRTLSGFIRGQTNVCLIMATYYAILLSSVGLKFGLLGGILTGVMLFVPFVGFATGFTLSMIIALFQFDDAAHVIAVMAIYGIGMLCESSLITPRLVGSKVGLHPVWIIFGMLSGATLFGLVGILIAVPVTAVIGVLVRFATARYLQSPLYSGE